MPLLNVDRSVYQLGCYEAGAPTENLVVEDAWWIFTTPDNAVALQLTTYGANLWYWDEDRDCAIRTAALDGITFNNEVPSQYYQADDAQVAYRWNMNETPYDSFTRLPASDAPSVTGDVASDFLAELPGEEQLVVEPNLISIRDSTGTVLLQEMFEIDPDWPCYNAQLTVFDRPGQQLYAVATFDTFGTMSDCEQAEGDSRYTIAISEWDPATKQFVRSFELVDVLRPLNEGGEDSLVHVTRVDEVAGGRLRMKRRVASRYEQGTEKDCEDRDASSGTCLRYRDCWRWASSNERESNFTLIGLDGVEIDLGSPRAGVRERGEDCR